MSYQRPPNDPYPPPGYSAAYPPPQGYPSSAPPPPYEGYAPPSQGYPYAPPPPPGGPRPYEGYQGYFAEGYPPPPPRPGQPQYPQHCHYEHYHYENQSATGCFSFLQGWGFNADYFFIGQRFYVGRPSEFGCTLLLLYDGGMLLLSMMVAVKDRSCLLCFRV
ncbi:hypothetical protein OWV82_002299 [Melia azedarach]|uniref:Uncharacterized protein n=1 Tax=Melia azedarach TaxID=155640 RepID=A0ACC1Z1C1_MELAZ|nr:hypothetical protein OWV82_002299 [Melia azedarach]